MAGTKKAARHAHWSIKQHQTTSNGSIQAQGAPPLQSYTSMCMRSPKLGKVHLSLVCKVGDSGGGGGVCVCVCVCIWGGERCTHGVANELDGQHAHQGGKPQSQTAIVGNTRWQHEKIRLWQTYRVAIFFLGRH